MAERKKYRLQVSALRGEWEVDKFVGHEDEVFEEELKDVTDMGAFRAKIMVSQTPKEGYDDLILVTDRGVNITGWYVKILEEEEEEEEAITVFESKKLGDRRGHMLKSMMDEEKTERKKEIMTTDLEEKLKRKREIAEEILKKQKR